MSEEQLIEGTCDAEEPTGVIRYTQKDIEEIQKDGKTVLIGDGIKVEIPTDLLKFTRADLIDGDTIEAVVEYSKADALDVLAETLDTFPVNELGMTANETVDAVAKRQKRFGQREIGFTLDSRDASIACASCTLFVRPWSGEHGGCLVVDGPIAWFGSCPLQISAVEEAAAIFSLEAAVAKESGVEKIEAMLKHADAIAEVRIIKTNDEPDKGFTFVLGPVLVPEEFDKQGDIISADVIEETAHNFMARSQKIGLMHERHIGTRNGVPVESYIQRAKGKIGGVEVSKGTWMLGVQIYNRELRDAALDGSLGGFSVGGLGISVEE